jgi:hypothetical protein
MTIQNTLLTTVPSSVYTSTGNSAVTSVYFCNSGATAVNFSVWAVPNGSTANINTRIYNNIQLASADTYVLDVEKLILGNGDSVQANATANTSISTTLSYIGI